MRLPLIFAPLKLFTYILSFYILFCAIAPCYLFDDCETTEQCADATKSNPVRDCNNCSPFSTCSSCHGFAFEETQPLNFTSNEAKIIFVNYTANSAKGYLGTLFQPPKTT